MFDYLEHIKNESILPVELTNKEKYFRDVSNIRYSFSGRVENELIINIFIAEGAKLLINAIALFELGYFDCAYYSLRSAVDFSTTMVFLADMPSSEKDEYFRNWKDGGDFAMRNEMIKLLTQRGNVFADMKSKMGDFFSDARELSQKLNKYVHKQGYHNLYVVANNPINAQKSRADFINVFEYYLKKCIGVVAVMRLATDPFPILLMDEEILFRCFDSVTEPYDEGFIIEYIGEKTINDYKKTDLYVGYYEWFMGMEKRNEATNYVLRDKFINTMMKDQILAQIQLLPTDYAVSATIALACSKVVKVYPPCILLFFFTERKSNRRGGICSVSTFEGFSKNSCKYNQAYDEAYISVFSYKDNDYYAEHNEVLSNDEIKCIFEEIGSYDDLMKRYAAEEGDINE